MAKVEIQTNVSSGIKVFENTETWKGERAVCWQFHLNELEETQKLIKALGARHAYQEIDSEKSYEQDLEHAKWLMEQGSSYDYYHDEENGIPFEKLPIEAQDKIGYHWGSYYKWSKWTPERIVASHGWEEDEVYWFSITKDDTYTYQLILKEGDWIAYCPVFKDVYEGRIFMNVDSNISLPFKSEWKEVKQYG